MSVLTRLRSTVAADQLVAIAEMRSGDLAPERRSSMRSPTACVRRSRPFDACAETLAALAETDASARGRLDSALRAPDRTLRWGATYGLSRLGPAPPQSLPTLLDALGSDDGDVRWATAAILAAMEHRDAVAEQLVGVARDGSPAQRKMALYCLRDMGRSLQQSMPCCSRHSTTLMSVCAWRQSRRYPGS